MDVKKSCCGYIPPTAIISTAIFSFALAGAVFLSSGVQLSAQGLPLGIKRLQSIRAAEETARRALAESATGLKIASIAKAGEFNKVITGEFQVDVEIAAQIKQVQFVESIYDEKTDIARVRAELGGGVVKTITGEKVDLGDQRISRIGFGTATPANAPALQALRAAEIDAYRQLAEYLGGIQIQGKTTVKDYVVESEALQASFIGALYGAALAADDPYGFDGETAYMNLELTLGKVQDILGQKLEYKDFKVKAKGQGAVLGTP